MEEIITGVRVIKMFAWETPFGQMIDGARKNELNILRKNSYVRCLYMTFALFTTRMAIFCTMLSICVLYGSENITSTKVNFLLHTLAHIVTSIHFFLAQIFVISAYFHLIASTLSQMFVRGVAELSEAYVSVKRLQSFLESDEMNDTITKEKDTTDADVISVTDLTANWTVKETNPKSNTDEETIEEISLQKNEQLSGQHDTLHKINVNIKKGSLVGIVGPVGAGNLLYSRCCRHVNSIFKSTGKSSFLQALLHELPTDSGSININGSISYACQEPWIFSASVRQNIIFSNPYDQQRYDMVIRSCALDVDIENFKSGDMLLIGDRGISLSGGQKARVK